LFTSLITCFLLPGKVSLAYQDHIEAAPNFAAWRLRDNGINPESRFLEGPQTGPVVLGDVAAEDKVCPLLLKAEDG